MISHLGSARLIPAALFRCALRPKAALLALLLALPLVAPHAFAQTTTTISGTVYDPRTTASSLPLPNVLVYVTSAAVDPLPAGVQCLTTSDPTGVVGFTYTAADGTFTIGNIPVNATYTVVIQAGKWRRQFSETVATDPVDGPCPAHALRPHPGRHPPDRHRHRLGGRAGVRPARHGHRPYGVHRRQRLRQCGRAHPSLQRHQLRPGRRSTPPLHRSLR